MYSFLPLRCDKSSFFLKAASLTMEGGRLKRSPQLVEGKDYVMVPEPVWRALYHWYGANLSLPRPVSCDFRHFLTSRFVQGNFLQSSPTSSCVWKSKLGKSSLQAGPGWKIVLFSRRFAAQSQGSGSRAEVLPSCCCLLKHTKLSLRSV